MKRPLGVILTSIALGLLAAAEILTALPLFGLAAMGAGAGVLSGQKVQADGPHATVAIATFLAASILLAVLAGWGIATLVGLLRLESWARQSIRLLAACLLTLILISVVTTAIALLRAPARTPALPPHTMQIVLLFEAIPYALAGILAGWWLVYFNLRSTAAYFLPAYRSGEPTQSES